MNFACTQSRFTKCPWLEMLKMWSSPLGMCWCPQGESREQKYTSTTYLHWLYSPGKKLGKSLSHLPLLGCSSWTSGWPCCGGYSCLLHLVGLPPRVVGTTLGTLRLFYFFLLLVPLASQSLFELANVNQNVLSIAPARPCLHS